MIDMFYDGPAALHRHVTDYNHGKTVYHCNDCNCVFSSQPNYRRHIAIVHHKQCIYCDDGEGDDEEDVGRGGLSRFIQCGNVDQ